MAKARGQGPSAKRRKSGSAGRSWNNSQKSKSKRARHQHGISEPRLQRALRVYSRTKDINAAARSIHVSVERLKRAALRRVARRKKPRTLAIVRTLPRKMPLFSNGNLLIVTVRSRSASLIGRYMAAVGQFLNSNNPKLLDDFKGRNVKDVKGTLYPFETEPNQLYRLSSMGEEPFEEVYRIVL